ncbi:MAG: imidazole glycerol phosphate synthase subunit HisF [Prochlorococcus sp. SP3034]|nr:imidazole glycerol phosphate synthase subunit HisF [Prochlorococcus sp. SP3034]|tara:strand:- start:2628 stop:3398 length:771 start_codon:yes stop_codon:yes gene_type:complete
MVALRLIPCLDVANGRVVKGVNFVNLRDAGDPVELANKYSEEGADELVFLDIKATYENRKTLVNLVSRTAKTVKIPFTVGGGIKSVTSINELLRAGADKVSLNSYAVYNPEIISESAEQFGRQCIVIAIDARLKIDKANEWEVYVKGGRENTGIDVISWAKKVEKLGAGEILLTSMDGDGTQKGYDLKLTEAVANELNIPVIASGGAGSLDDIFEVFSKGKASAALLASLLHDRKLTIKQIKSFLIEKDLIVRPNS